MVKQVGKMSKVSFIIIYMPVIFMLIISFDRSRFYVNLQQVINRYDTVLITMVAVSW
jgi:hypothetical protein